MPPHWLAGLAAACASCWARNDALGYQRPTAQSLSLKVATSGPWTRSAYWFSAPAVPKGMF